MICTTLHLMLLFLILPLFLIHPLLTALSPIQGITSIVHEDVGPLDTAVLPIWRNPDIPILATTKEANHCEPPLVVMEDMKFQPTRLVRLGTWITSHPKIAMCTTEVNSTTVLSINVTVPGTIVPLRI